ncbi:MAG: HAD hydrolase family protein [Candidatus Lokiarchaeota archaeon]|nr:HAD hydrolase family protein [Candidatus Lokiarchaeota archaeon]
MRKAKVFIPMRKGSKGFPGKNKTYLSRKPLYFWAVKSALDCQSVDKVIVATDDRSIFDELKSFFPGYEKLYLFDRVNSEDTNDTSSTEDAILSWFISWNIVNSEDLIVLRQVTNPFVTSEDLQKAINEHTLGCVMVSASESDRFMWYHTGTNWKANYDIRNRPRRQDINEKNFNRFSIENGAFYIFSAKDLLENGNRLADGKNVQLYLMSSHTQFEIDTPEDFCLVDTAFSLYGYSKLIGDTNDEGIKLLVCDVDGTLTNGKMNYSETGKLFKTYDTKDAYTIQALHKSGKCQVIFLSGESAINEGIAESLGIPFFGDCFNKWEFLQKYCYKNKIFLENVAYIGDDINDLTAMSNVRIPACPKNADKALKLLDGVYLCDRKGGDGAIREFVDYLFPGFVKSFADKS